MILWIGNLGMAQWGAGSRSPLSWLPHLQSMASVAGGWLVQGDLTWDGCSLLQGPLSFRGLAQAHSHAVGLGSKERAKCTRFLEAQLRTGPRSLLSPSVEPSKSQVQPRFREWEHQLHLFMGGAAESYCKGRTVREGNHYRHSTVYLSPEFCRFSGCSVVTNIT